MRGEGREGGPERRKEGRNEETRKGGKGGRKAVVRQEGRETGRVRGPCANHWRDWGSKAKDDQAK